MSRQQLADLLNVNRAAVAAWEKGAYQPRGQRLSALATVLGVGREELSDAIRSSANRANLVDTVRDLPLLLVDLTSRASLLRGFRLAAPYATAAYVQTDWRLLVEKKIRGGTLEVQRVEIFYDLKRLQEVLANIIRLDGCKYYVKNYCAGLNEVAPTMGGYLFDREEILIGAYWTGVPPVDKPGLHLSSEPFATFFAEYWGEIWSHGTWLNPRGKHDLSEIKATAEALGLAPEEWHSFVEHARDLEIGDGAPPLF